MFWIYGVCFGVTPVLLKNADTKQGNLQFGSGSLQAYDGTSLAVTQDVVVVTINYRTNSKASLIRFHVQYADHLR